MLCTKLGKFPVVYDVPTEQQMGVDEVGKIQLAQHCSPFFNVEMRHCFAGQNDELVFSASEAADHNLSIWSLPADQQGIYQVIDQPLAVLKGHKGEINSVCYNHRTGMLASAGAERIIKLWTPIAQE